MKLDISARLKEKRTEKRINKSELARLIGVSPSAIGQYESGETRPKVEVILKLSEILNWDFINNKPLVNKESSTGNRDFTKDNYGQINFEEASHFDELKMGNSKQFDPDINPYQENATYGGSKLPKSRDEQVELYNRLEGLFKSQQTQLIDILTSNRIIQDQLDILKGLILN